MEQAAAHGIELEVSKRERLKRQTVIDPIPALFVCALLDGPLELGCGSWLTSSSPHPAWLATTQGYRVYANPTLERLTGFDSDQINQADWRSFLLEEGPSRRDSFLAKVPLLFLRLFVVVFCNYLS